MMLLSNYGETSVPRDRFHKEWKHTREVVRSIRGVWSSTQAPGSGLNCDVSFHKVE